jgi:hypothetical protein
MKKLLLDAALILILAALVFVGCEKETTSPTEASFRRGGRGNNSTTTTATNDSLLASCGILFTDSGQFYPTVQLSNLRWRKVTGYSYDPATGGYTYPYDILVIEFDAPVIPGKTVNCYLLNADQCQGRVVCNKRNGVEMSQVTTCNGTTRFWLPIGNTWLNPNVQTYTGAIQIGTTDGCIVYSQFFTFEPPRILSI